VAAPGCHCLGTPPHGGGGGNVTAWEKKKNKTGGERPEKNCPMLARKKIHLNQIGANQTIEKKGGGKKETGVGGENRNQRMLNN